MFVCIFLLDKKCVIKFKIYILDVKYIYVFLYVFVWFYVN